MNSRIGKRRRGISRTRSHEIQNPRLGQPDLIEGYRFYERQAEGVGSYFLDSLYSDIDSLIISAGMQLVHFGKHHRLLSKRFPFAIYYRVEGQTILVYAVLDCRRNPAWIRKRLS